MNPHITATDLFNYAKCAHRPYMDFTADPKLKVEIHPLVKLLWESGVQYESKVIESLKSSHPDKSFVEIGKGQPLSKDLFLQTQEAMQNGADIIYQGVIVADDLAGRPDLLVKVPGDSDFGNYHYEPMDIKLARVESTWDDGKEKIQKEQLWQMHFYGDVLEKVQGVKPATGYIYKTKSRKLPVNLHKPYSAYQEALQKIRDQRDGETTSTCPALSANCKMCEWKVACKAWIKDNNDITQIYYVGSAMQKGLHELGIKTPQDLAKQDAEELKPLVQDLKNQGYFWKTMPGDLINKSIERAKIFLSGKPKIHRPIEFPDHQYEIHYDLEDDPTQDFVYLHGLVIAEKGKDPEYHAFFAESPEDEMKITKELFDFLKSYPGTPVYHYSPYEKITLKRLLSKYKDLDQSVFEMLFGDNGSAVDLLKIINDQTDWPLSSYSIKDICRFLGFDWDASDASGASSIVWMNDYMNGQRDLKPKILRYNEDDCVASYHLKKSLEMMQNSAK